MSAQYRYWRVLATVARARRNARATPRGSPPTSTTSAVATATSAPEPIAIPRSARASAGASFTPSPTIATRWPAAWSSATRSALPSGRTSARASSIPSSRAIASATRRASPETSTVRKPIRRSSAIASRAAAFGVLREAVRAGERGVADPHVVAFDGRVNTPSGQRLERRRLGEGKALRRGELDDCSREGMLRSRFGAREDADDLVLAYACAVHVVDDLRPADGERPGLVERDHVDRACDLERLRALDQYPA